MKSLSQRAARTAWIKYRSEWTGARDSRLNGFSEAHAVRSGRARAALDRYNRIARRAGDCLVAWEAP